MRYLFILILLCIFAGHVLAQSCTKYNVITGYGYLTNSNDDITSYTNYPVGNVCIPTGYTYTEVANQQALSNITLYQPPVNAVQAFNTDTFVQQLATTPLISDPNLFSFYAVLKDMTYYKNFQGLANLIGGLLQSGTINQGEVDIIDNALENQQINLDSYNSEVNVSY